MASVLLSASVERCFVSHMRDFFISYQEKLFLKVWEISDKEKWCFYPQYALISINLQSYLLNIARNIALKQYVPLWDPDYMKLKQVIVPCPLDCKTMKHWNVFPTILQTCWHMCYSWKIVGTTFRCHIACSSIPGRSPNFQSIGPGADAFYKSICPSVCLSVCPFVCSLFPIFLEIWNPWGKVMERRGLRFEHFSGIKLPNKKIFFLLILPYKTRWKPRFPMD